MPKAHFEILDEKRRKILPLFKPFKDRFYLAGGTGLALQIAHRDSVDFDFFTANNFDPENLLREFKDIFSGYSVDLIQAGNKTLNIIIDGDIKASFFCIKEQLLSPLLDMEYFNTAGITDIACMKIAALLRAVFKDYVDLYYIFKQQPMELVFDNCKKKYPGFDEAVYLKALVSLDDIEDSDVLFERGQKVTKDQIRKDFEKRVKEYLNSKI